MGRAILVLSLIISVSAYGEDPQLRNHRCYPQLSAILNQWESSRAWRLEDSGPIQIHRSATSQRGVWLESHRYPNGRMELVKLAGQDLTRYVWEPGSCESTSSRQKLSYDSLRLKEAFSDAYLDDILKRNRAGVIYAWSPHMPLSVDGRYRVQRAAARLKLKVFVALDPHADAAMAKSVVSRKGWDASTLRRLESIELFNRGMVNHYPVMVVFENGNIVGTAFPGVKEEAVYEKFISDTLARK